MFNEREDRPALRTAPLEPEILRGDFVRLGTLWADANRHGRLASAEKILAILNESDGLVKPSHFEGMLSSEWFL